MQIAQHLTHLEQDGTRLADAVTSLEADVPACPPWTVRQLVTHIGGVHRYAAQIVRDRLAEDPAETEDDLAQPGDADLLEWFRAGHAELLATLRGADPDVQCLTFFAAPSPLEFWARRQAHETAIHRADAESATGPITPFVAEFAADGIDEMITGFASRKRKFHEVDAPRTLAIRPDDADPWLLTIAADGLHREDSTDGLVGTADARVGGSASDLYLWMWNRPSPVHVAGDEDVAALWRQIRVRWA